MIIPAKIINECVNCGGNLIELYDSFGKQMNYNLMKSMNNFKSIDTTKGYLSHFRCGKCGKIYPIIWENGIPKPLMSDTRIDNFILNFIKEE